MKVLVTGRDGQVALSLAERAPLHGLHPVFAARPDFDLAKPDALGKALDAIRPDVVVSAAAYRAVDLAEDEPQLAHAVNAEGPATLAQWCAAIDHGAGDRSANACVRTWLFWPIFVSSTV